MKLLYSDTSSKRTPFLGSDGVRHREVLLYFKEQRPYLFKTFSRFSYGICPMTPGAGLDIYNDRDHWSSFGFYVFSIGHSFCSFLVVK